MGELLTSLAGRILDAYWLVLAGHAICLGLELIWPASACSLASRARAASFWLVGGSIAAACSASASALIRVAHIQPLLHFCPTAPAWFSGPIGLAIIAIPTTLCAAAVSDFFQYWLHRASHAVPFLWRIHRVHHSIRELSGWNSYAHVGEGLLQIPFVLLPLSLLVRIDQPYAPLAVITLLRFHGIFQHSCARLHFGPLRFLLSDNAFHRIHHSVDPCHLRKNFCNFTPLWDIVFGTAYFPTKTEWPAVGLLEVPEPKTLAAFLTTPFLENLAVQGHDPIERGEPGAAVALSSRPAAAPRSLRWGQIILKTGYHHARPPRPSQG